MQDREISPSGQEFQPGTSHLASSLVQIPTPWERFLYPAWTLMMDFYSLFCFCVLLSNIYPKIKFRAKNWSGLCNFYNKVISFKLLSKKIFFTFFC